MRTISVWTLVLLVCVFVAGCSQPASPSNALSGVTSEASPASDGPGPRSSRTLDEGSIAAAKPSSKATNLNLKGIVSEVDTDELTITVSGKLIHVPATAKIIDAMESPLTFSEITVGKRVHVTGKTVGGISTASIVRVLSYAVTGTVSSLAGTCPEVTFTVGDQDVATTATTEFQYGDCGKLADGMQVEVQGTVDADLLMTAARVVLPKKTPPKPVKNVRVKGTITAMEDGTCPTKTFTVAGEEVRTSASTRFTGSGKCPAIAINKTVDITGVQESDHVRAVRVNVSKK